jgi:hypothetical protein
MYSTGHGIVAQIRNYTAILDPSDCVTIRDGIPGEALLEHRVPNYGTSLWDPMHRDGAAIGWARMIDDAEVLYLYDRRDGFGYALNVTAPECSEWGYAPFWDSLLTPC